MSLKRNFSRIYFYSNFLLVATTWNLEREMRLYGLWVLTLLDYWPRKQWKVFAHIKSKETWNWGCRLTNCEATTGAWRSKCEVTKWVCSFLLSIKHKHVCLEDKFSLVFGVVRVKRSKLSKKKKITSTTFTQVQTIRKITDDVMAMSLRLLELGPGDGKFPVYKLKVWTCVERCDMHQEGRE